MEFLKKNAFSIYYFGLILMAVSLPLSKFLTGLSLFVIIGAWVVEGNYKLKLKQFWENKIAVLWCSLFFLHLIGLLYTTNFHYAWNDLRIKLPLLLLPFIISSTTPLNSAQLKNILVYFISAVVLSTIISFAALLGFFDKDISEVRNISFLISHIRFALLICLAIFFQFYFLKNSSGTSLLKITQLIVLCWLILFLILLESFTGIVIGIAITLFLLLHQLFKKGNKFIKIASLSFLILIPTLLCINLYQNYRALVMVNPVNLTQLESLTLNGRPYIHFLDQIETENGNYYGIYVCKPEVDKEWKLRSKFNIDSFDLRHQPIRATLYRFLTSKGLRKDSLGINALSDREIKAIEGGITNVNYQDQFSTNARIQQIFWEINSYLANGNPTGHSITMRFEYWKTGWLIFKENPILGVGTGDVNDAFLEKYKQTNSQLALNWRLRAHNQYLTFALSFGLIGITWFLFTLLYPIVHHFKNLNYFYMIFFAIALLSMLNEDTLETQAGVTFYAFFNSLLWFSEKIEEKRKVNSEN